MPSRNTAKTNRPVEMNVARDKDHVVVKFGDLVIGIPPATARQFAESILEAVADIEGNSAFLIKMTGPYPFPQ